MMIGALAACLGCERREYDASTPQAAMDSMYQLIRDGQASRLGEFIHIEARDITYDDGVTEASAIAEVTDKAGDMLGQLYRVADKLRTRFPNDVATELDAARDEAARRGSGGGWLSRFLTDPFGLVDEQRTRLTVEDLGDGTAAILLDGEPVLAAGLLMRDVDGQWKVEIPMSLLQQYRPDTRHEWSVLASMMLSVERSLADFEQEIDDGKFRSLRHASERAGRLLGESVVVQSIIYAAMKQKEPASDGAKDSPSPPADQPAG
jgi:hypothetical protein